MRTDDERGFILHRYPYGETSVLLEAFTYDFGRVGLVGRGVRRGGRAFAGAQLRPFQPLLLSWSGRGGDLSTLVRAEAPEAAISLGGNAVWCGFYVNELLLRLLHRHDPHADLYVAYDEVLRSLAVSGCQESALRIFEKRLLAALGYGLTLAREAHTGEPVRADLTYRYVRDEGVVRAGPDTPGRTVGGATLMALAREDFRDATALREAKGLLGDALAPLLGDRPLYTRGLFRTMQAARKPPRE